MSAESKLAQLRLEERDLLRTKCARCGHPLAVHSRMQQNCSGHPLEKRACKCRDFVETTDEQLGFK